MTVFALDSNVAIAVIKEDAYVRKRLDKARGKGHSVVLPSIVLHELALGVEKSAYPKTTAARLQAFLKLAREILAFDQSDALSAGKIRAQLEMAGTPIGPYDTLIAGQVLNRGLTLVTHNTKEFARVKGLLLANWHAPSTR